MKLTLLHTNDVHSHFEEWAKLVTLLKSLRQEYRQKGFEVLTLDAGDHLDMSHPMTIGTGGLLNARLLASAGYDCFTLGNNESERLTRKQIERAAATLEVSWLAANLRDEIHPTQYPAGVLPYKIYELSGVRVGIFGLTVHFPAAFHKQGMANPAASVVIPKMVQELRSQGCELLIFLSHLGLPKDRFWALENLGIDVIVGAHTHDRLAKPEKYGETWIVQAGCFASDIGVLELTKPSGSSRWEVSGRLVTVDTYRPSPDAEVLQELHQGQAEAEAYLEQPAFFLEAPLIHHMTEGSPFAEFAARALYLEFEADFAFLNGGFGIKGLSAGVITRKDLLEACPSLLNPGVVLLTGRQLYQFFEEAEQEEKYNVFQPGMGLRGDGVVVGRLYTYGLQVQKSPAAPLGKRIQGLFTQGQELLLDQTYRVAAPAFFSGSFSGFASLEGAALLDWLSPELIRDVVASQYQDKQKSCQSF